MANSQGGLPDLGRRFLNWLREDKKRILLVASLLCLILGFGGGLITARGFYLSLFFDGLVLLFIWIVLRFGLVVVREQVVEEWGILVGGAQERAEEVFGDTERLISETKVPDIKMERRDIAPGVIRGALGGRRPFLVITNKTNMNLGPYRMCINARDYGNNLQVSWYLVHHPGFLRRMLVFLLLIPGLNLLILPFYLVGRLLTARQAGLLGLDLFDLQDLTAYVTNAHHCLLEAVEKLMLELNQEPSKIERKSRGFLGIS